MDFYVTFTDVRYWSKGVLSTILTHLGDLEVKDIDSEILCIHTLMFWLKLFEDLYTLNPWRDMVNICIDDRQWSSFYDV